MIIGNNADVDSSNASNRIVIGNNASNTNNNSAVIGDSNIYEVKTGGGSYNLSSVVLSSSGGAPSINSNFIGQLYIDKDSVTKAAYIAVNSGTGSSDWLQIG